MGSARHGRQQAFGSGLGPEFNHLVGRWWEWESNTGVCHQYKQAGPWDSAKQQRGINWGRVVIVGKGNFLS